MCLTGRNLPPPRFHAILLPYRKSSLTITDILLYPLVLLLAVLVTLWRVVTRICTWIYNLIRR
jgi:hypothetical protein